MNSPRGAPPCATAVLLREIADACRSREALCARLEALSFAELQALLRDVADLLERLPARASVGSSDGAPCPPQAAPSTPGLPRAPHQPHQESFGFEANGHQANRAAVRTSGVQAREDPADKPRKLLLYSDGASRGNPGPAGAGAVLMKPDGTIVARLGKYLGRQTNNHAEYMALIIGLRAALDLGATDIEMIADSELLVKQIKKVYRVKNEQLKALYDEATALISRFPRATIRHVLREYNREADEMSNRAIDERM